VKAIGVSGYRQETIDTTVPLPRGVLLRREYCSGLTDKWRVEIDFGDIVQAANDVTSVTLPSKNHVIST